jgi:uncharacterized protein with beta-barrel porin domain
MTFTGSTAAFTGNIAAGGSEASGGAIYNDIDSIITFDASRAVFSSNTANGAANDIHNLGVLNVTNNSYMEIGGGISGNGTVNIVSGSKVRFDGVSEIGRMYIGENGEAVLAGNAGLKGGEITVANGTLDMQNDNAETIEADKFEIGANGNLKIDVLDDDTNDKIIAETAKVEGGNLDIKVRMGTYENKEYEIIVSANVRESYEQFASTSSNNPLLHYRLDYTDLNVIKLIINGTYASDFGKIKGLTYNQKETAGVFDRMSRSGRASDEFEDFIEEYIAKSEEEQKEMLAQTSGYFLANVIRNAAADSPSNEVYDKIRKREADMTNSGIWAQVKGGLETFKGSGSSPEDYKDTSIGLMFGYDRYMEDKDIMWGAYARFNKDNIEQGRSSADGQKNGLGAYGGYIQDKYEVKAMLLGSLDKFNTERYVLGNKAKADINAVTISADVEGALKYKLNEEIIIKPYAGLEAENVNYGSFKEKGAGILDLEVNGGNYFRSAGRIGAGVEYEKSKWIAYAKAEWKYIMSGREPEIESVFKGTREEFKSRGVEEGAMEAGIGAGAEMKVTDNLKVYANANYYIADRYSNISGNIGARYMFGK